MPKVAVKVTMVRITGLKLSEAQMKDHNWETTAQVEDSTETLLIKN